MLTMLRSDQDAQAWVMEAEEAATRCAERVHSVYDEGKYPVGAEFFRLALKAIADAGLARFDMLSAETGALTDRDLIFATAGMRRLAFYSGTLASIYMVHFILAPYALALLATPDQRRKVLPAIGQGRIAVAFALTEPDAGSDAASLTSKATALNEGFALSGQKIYITGADQADHIIVAAKDSRSNGGREAIGLFLVRGDAPGLSVHPLPKQAMNAHASCLVQMEDVRLADAHKIGSDEAVGGAWNALRETGTVERLIVTAMATGLGEAIAARSRAFATSRRQFNEVISRFQAIQHRLVEMEMEVTGMRLFMAQALRALRDGEDAEYTVAMAKAYCAERLQLVTASAQRVLGGRAFFGFEEICRLAAEAPFVLYAGGTVEIQKMIAARHLGLAR